MQLKMDKDIRSGFKDGKTALVARLDFHTWGGRLVGRTRAKCNEIEKGVQMIQNIKDKFGLTDKEVRDITDKMLMQETLEQAKNFENSSTKIQWNRDNKGRITSPFSTKNL